MKPLHYAIAVTALVVAGVAAYRLAREPDSRQAGPAAAGGGGGAISNRQAADTDPLSSSIDAVTGGDGSLAALMDLRDSLAAMPRDRAVELIRGFLATGRDRPTGLSFEIAGDGTLEEWPTFRTFLLDELAGIDPAAAAAIGREILANPTSADEWALALRNVARFEPLAQNRGFLLGKTEELIRNPSWQDAPSVGYLNAFDVLVHIEAAESTPLLSELLQRKDRKDLAHAAFLTLDRLVQRRPADVLNRLNADAALRQGRPEMVAQQFARADLRDASQRDIVRAWLVDPARTAVELQSFAGVFPNNNRFISHNLLTDETPKTGDELAAHDREVLQTVSGWVGDPGFSRIKPWLELMVSRLEGFAGAGTVSTPPESAADPPPSTR